MKPFSVVASSVAVVVGVGGGALAYQGVSESVPGAVAADQQSSAPGQHATVDLTAVEHRFAPCEPPTVRQGRACVLDVVKTVVVPSSASPSAPSSTGATREESNSDERQSRSHEGDDEDAAEPEATYEQETDDHEQDEDDHEPDDHEQDD